MTVVTTVTARKSRTAQFVLFPVLTAFAALILLPFLWVVSGAFKTQAEMLTDPGAWFPESFANVSNFVTLFVEKDFGVYLVNSLIVSGVAVVCNVLLATSAGYALAKLRFRGQRLVLAAMLAAMMIPYVALVVPQFLVVVQLGLVNTLTAIILPVAVMPICVFIARQYVLTLPDELIEAARIDGAGEVRIFLRIILPLLGPAVATIAIMSFLNSWNYFLWPLIVAQSQSTYTLPVGLSVASQASNTTNWGLLLAGAVVVLLPVLILFLFLQKYFVRGVAMTGMR